MAWLYGLLFVPSHILSPRERPNFYISCEHHSFSCNMNNFLAARLYNSLFSKIPLHLSSHREGPFFYISGKNFLFSCNMYSFSKLNCAFCDFIKNKKHRKEPIMQTEFLLPVDWLLAMLIICGRYSDVNQLLQDDFIHTVPNTVHSPDPFQLVDGFKLFCNSLLLCQLRNKLLLHFIGLPVYFFQMRIQRAFHEHSGIKSFPVISEITVPQCPPVTNFGVFWRNEVGE